MVIFLFIIIIFIVLIIKNGSISNLEKGVNAENALVSKLLRAGVSKEDIFHDLYVEKYNGNFSQIDLVILTKTGIIVVEVKNYSGWIFGNGNQKQWTQVLAYGKQKYRFYNPIMQNSNHILELRKSLRQFQIIPFYSVIIFDGNCELKNISSIPENTFISKSSMTLDVINAIINSNEIFHYTNKNEIIQLLRKYVLNGENKEIRNQHSNNIERK